MPSIREINLDYLAPIPPEVKVIVVDDSNGGIEPNRDNMEIFRYADYRDVLGDQEDLIPRKTDTCRSFGFYMAWKQGYRYIVTLDDDCLTHPGFLGHHAILGQDTQVKSVESLPWYNTLDNLVLETNGEASKRWYARGVPYRYRIEPPVEPTYGTVEGRVVCNMGMWLKVPDINGLDKIDHEVPDGVSMREPRLAVAPGTNFSLCIMNVGILAEAIPAFYQLPMNIEICNARLDRFGDIWSGYILKKLADVRGDLVTLGDPCVTHTKAGNTNRETRVEHFGHLLENYFYRFVDEAASKTASADYAQMYGQFSENFAAAAVADKLPPGYDEFFGRMSDKMIRWAKLFV
ncbi:MAG: hypothetical protein V3R99_13350 [Thermoguttaceae bacterium]